MTGLGWCRKSSKRLIVLDFLLEASWYIAAFVVGLIHLVVLVVQRRSEQLPDLLGTTAGTFGILGFMTWVLWDARRAGKRSRRGRDAAAGVASESGADQMTPNERAAGGPA